MPLDTVYTPWVAQCHSLDPERAYAAKEACRRNMFCSLLSTCHLLFMLHCFEGPLAHQRGLGIEGIYRADKGKPSPLSLSECAHFEILELPTNRGLWKVESIFTKEI